MKKIITGLLMGFCVACASADPILLWGSDQAFPGGTDQVVYTNGVAVSGADNWLVELVNTADDSVLYSTTDGFSLVDGIFYDTPDASGWNGLSVKTVIYDASTKEAAGLFAEFSIPVTLSWATDPAVPGSIEYNAGSVSSVFGAGAGQWQQVVPEPAVASLVGIFGCGLIFIKRRLSK